MGISYAIIWDDLGIWHEAWVCLPQDESAEPLWSTLIPQRNKKSWACVLTSLRSPVSKKVHGLRMLKVQLQLEICLDMEICLVQCLRYNCNFRKKIWICLEWKPWSHCQPSGDLWRIFLLHHPQMPFQQGLKQVPGWISPPLEDYGKWNICQNYSFFTMSPPISICSFINPIDTIVRSTINHHKSIHTYSWEYHISSQIHETVGSSINPQ